MRRILLAAVLALSLGCMGAFNGLTGMDLDMRWGEDSVHPADFAVAPPAGGQKAFSMGMTADADSINLPEGVDVDLSAYDKVRMDLVAYGVDDVNAATATAAEQAIAGGWSEVKADASGTRSFSKGGDLFVVAQGEDDTGDTLVLIRLVPKDAPAE